MTAPVQSTSCWLSSTNKTASLPKHSYRWESPRRQYAVIRQAPGRKQEDRRAPVAKYTRQAENVLDLSLHEALRLGDNQIGTEHILLALTREPGSVAVEVLARMNIDPKRISHQIVQLRKFAREESLRR
jgi:ATP-dependent Clp protease ATP-binding subunit ClpA